MFFRKIWMREYLSCIRSNLFIIVQICLALFLINNQVDYIASELERLGSIVEADEDTWLFQYAMAAAGLFDIENGDYTAACEKIRSLPGVEGLGEIFNTSVYIPGDSEKYPEDYFGIAAMDSIVTSAVTYHMKEGRWLNGSDREGEVVHVALGGAIAERYGIGDSLKIVTDSGGEYEAEVVGKLAERCNVLDFTGLAAGQDMSSFMNEARNNIFVNHDEVFRDIKKEGFGHSTAHCIVKLDPEADKEFLSGYGKLVSFEEMKQETEEDLRDFAIEAAEEGTIWIVVILFGVIAVAYLVGKKRRYVWGIYLMLGEKPRRLLGIQMINNGITYLIAVTASIVIYDIYINSEDMPFGLGISGYLIMADTVFFLIMMAVSLMSSRYIMKIEPKEILTQTKE